MVIRGAAGVVLAFLALAPTALAVSHPAPIPSRGPVPLGSALWYACADPAYAGPVPLSCVVPGFDARYPATYVESFDRLTPENEFKMAWTQPERGRFDFSVADALVRFAQANGKAIRGHTLVYAAANPGWVENPLTPWTRESLLATMRTHITTMVGRYKGAVHEWDVVNEPFLGSGARNPNVYERIIGPDWIEQAFRAADAADPDAILLLNEFNADVRGPRQQALLALARDFVARGVPIDGIGLEMHVGADGTYPTLTELKDVMADYAALGLRVEVTETDALRPADPTLDAVLVQRAAYDTVARACQESPNCTGMSVWGVADAYSWRSAGQTATLFTANFGKKRAYDLVRCRLADPRPATGPWTPRDCGPVQTPPPATTTPTGPADGSSAVSNPSPAPLAVTVPPEATVAAVATGPVAPRVPAAPAPSAVQPRSVRTSVRLASSRPTRAQLARGITTRIVGARPGAQVTVRVRRGDRLLTALTRKATSTGDLTLTVRLTSANRRSIRRRTTLTVTVALRDSLNRRSVQRRSLRVR